MNVMHIYSARYLPAVALLFLGGCAGANVFYTAEYRPEYVRPRVVSPEERITGKALIVTERGADEITYIGFVTKSFRVPLLDWGKLEMPLGLMIREIADTVFSEVCTDGADHARTRTAGNDYVIVVRPELVVFEYGYQQPMGPGQPAMAKARVDLSVRVLDPDGLTIFDKSYASGWREGPIPSPTPEDRPETVNKIAHQSIYDLLRNAASDIARHLQAVPVKG